MTYKPRKLNPDLPFHITARANNRERFPMPLDETWELFSDYLFLISKFFGIRIHSFVLMPNHFHMIARDPEMNLSTSMNYFMRETSKLMARDTHRINRIWGAPFGSSLISSPLYYLHAYRYVYNNPVRAGLCDNAFQYRFSTLQTLIGLQRTIIPLEYDDTLFENFESAHKWLLEPPKKKESEDTRLALRRKEFKFPRDEITKKQNFLEQPDSIPDFFRKSRAFPSGKALPPVTPGR
jgi:REP element-mobilizing transposase RayT